MASSVRARAAVIYLLFSVHAIAHAGSITEAEAVRLFLEESPQALRVPAVAGSVEAAGRVGTAVPNPAVTFHVEEAGGARDTFLTFGQELPIDGRRGLTREAAQVASVSAELFAEHDLRAATAALREAFYEILFRENELARWRDCERRIQNIVRVLAEREREGEGSGYDLLRAEQGLAELGIASLEAQAALAAARSRFGSFFHPAMSMAAAELQGDLATTTPIPPTEDAIERALVRRSDLAALRAEARRTELAQRTAKRRRVPRPTLTAGWKRTEAPGLDDTGFLAAVTLPLPLFDQGKLGARQADSDRQRIAIDIEKLERTVRSEVHAALSRERIAREAARRYGESIETRAAQLQSIAELAYAEGETGILELVDAHRTSVETETRALALRYQARIAEIHRQRVIGTEVNP